MTKQTFKMLQTMACMAVAAITMSGCLNGSSSRGLDYLPVQMSKGDNWSIVDKDGKEVVKEEFPSEAGLSEIFDGVFWVKQNDKYQMFSLKDPKKPVIDEEFAHATPFVAGRAVVSKPNQQIRILDTSGKTVATLPKNIKRCYRFSENGYAVFLSTDGKCGVLDNSGNVVVPASYADINMEQENLVIAKKKQDDTKLLILDMKGTKVGQIDTEKYYLLNSGFREGKLLVRKVTDEASPTIALDKTGTKLFEIKKATQKYWSEEYSDGYLVFDNEDSQSGVADDKGEVIIRPKYDSMGNLGGGLFAAKKNDKWGIVDTKDETVVDYDYEQIVCRMGKNFLVKDGNDYAIIDKEGKEIASFLNIGIYSDYYAEYVDVEGLASSVVALIEQYEKCQTARQYAKAEKLDLDSYHYSSYTSNNHDLDGKLSVSASIYFEGGMTEEKTHQEEVNDGWWSYTRTVSDGWNWTSNTMSSATLDVTSSDDAIKIKDVYNSVKAKIAQNRKKISDDTYSKVVTAGGKKVESRTTLQLNDNNLSVAIGFQQ